MLKQDQTLQEIQKGFYNESNMSYQGTVEIHLKSKNPIYIDITKHIQSYNSGYYKLTFNYIGTYIKKIVYISYITMNNGYEININHDWIHIHKELARHLKNNGLNIPKIKGKTSILISRLLVALKNNITGLEIHHKDFNTNNNHLSNLLLITEEEHQNIHLNDTRDHYYKHLQKNSQFSSYYITTSAIPNSLYSKDLSPLEIAQKGRSARVLKNLQVNNINLGNNNFVFVISDDVKNRVLLLSSNTYFTSKLLPTGIVVDFGKISNLVDKDLAA